MKLYRVSLVALVALLGVSLSAASRITKPGEEEVKGVVPGNGVASPKSDELDKDIEFANSAWNLVQRAWRTVSGFTVGSDENSGTDGKDGKSPSADEEEGGSSSADEEEDESSGANEEEDESSGANQGQPESQSGGSNNPKAKKSIWEKIVDEYNGFNEEALEAHVLG